MHNKCQGSELTIWMGVGLLPGARSATGQASTLVVEDQIKTANASEAPNSKGCLPPASGAEPPGVHFAHVAHANEADREAVHVRCRVLLRHRQRRKLPCCEKKRSRETSHILRPDLV